jgi:AcrR family transcriptional regulator
MAATSPPKSPALRERYDRRRAAVIAIAAKLFAERGYEATSIAELTAATGLAAGGIYHYIERKDDLLVAICDELLEPLLEQAHAIVAEPAPAAKQLRSLLRAWLEHIEGHRDHMLVFTRERQIIESEPEWQRVRGQRKEFEQILDDVLARGEREGTMAFADRGLALLALLGMVNYTAQWLRPRGRLAAAEIADGYCDLLLGAKA